MDEDSAPSLSKSTVFYPNGYGNSKPLKNSSGKSLFESCYAVEPWYTTYKETWQVIEDKIEAHNSSMYNTVLSNLVQYIKDCYSTEDGDMFENIIPSATLLTGVNQPDHQAQFTALQQHLRREVTPHIAIVQSEDAPTIKHLIENVVSKLISDESLDDLSDYDEEISFSPKKKHKLKKNQLTMRYLKKWFLINTTNKTVKGSPKKRKKDDVKPLVVILPDFESFNGEVLQDFVTIISSYTSSLPIVLVFGVATTVSALHRSFPYHVSSKLLIQVFQSYASPVCLNKVLEEVFLTHTCPFLLSGKSFEFLMDLFLFYDLSVTGFTDGFKFCMMDHYFGDTIKSLCCDPSKLDEAIAQLTSEDLETIRRLPSFRPYLEQQDCRKKISLFEDDEYFRKDLKERLNDFHEYLYNFYSSMRLLNGLVKDLPKNVLGKHLRETYIKCSNSLITETKEFKESIQLLSFQSKSKLIETLKNILKIVNSVIQKEPMGQSNQISSKNITYSTVKIQISGFLRQIGSSNVEVTLRSPEKEEEFQEEDNMSVFALNRHELKEKLLKARQKATAKPVIVQSEYQMIRERLLDYLVEIFTELLAPPQSKPFYEIFVFENINNVKRNLVASPRAIMHTALSNPAVYLKCKCCVLPSPDSILPSMPDVCIVYKLHLECGRQISVHDWMTAFASIMDPSFGTEEDDDEKEIPAEIQSRFQEAVSQLQYMGFIKPSRRGNDFYTRLTW